MHRSHSFKANGHDVSLGVNRPRTTHRHSANVLCLHWLDGRRMLFNYAYFVVADLETNNCLALIFTSHIVILHGYNLAILFELFSYDWQQKIEQQDKRYYSLSDKHNYFVYDINVESNN